jgi:pimeloyl-ACP methyl ester carboxylesterase
MKIIRAARDNGLRFITTAAILAIAGLLVPVSQIASADTAARSTAASGTRPSIVLVHGAFADGSSWDAVVSRLQSEGYRVYDPPNPLQGLSYDSAYLADFLHGIAGPIILVGHSYGGAIITNAATGERQVKALVYVDGFWLLRGAGEPQPSAVSRRTRRHRRRLHQAERLPVLLRERSACQRSQCSRGHPAAAVNRRTHAEIRSPRLEDDPVLGRDRHRGPRHPASRTAGYGPASARPHHHDSRCPAPVDDLQPRRRHQGHPRRRALYYLSNTATRDDQLVPAVPNAGRHQLSATTIGWDAAATASRARAAE